MKNKFLILSVLFAFMALGFVSCSDDEPIKEIPIELSLVGSQSVFEFASAGGEQKVALKSNYPFGVEMSPVEDSSWCKVKASENELNIRMLPNWEIEDRSSKVKIFAGEGEKMQVLYLDVLQKGGEPFSIMLSPEKLILSPAEEEKEVVYMTTSPNISYKWQGDSVVNWVDVQLDTVNTKFVFATQANISLEGRRAVLEISGGVGNNLFTDTLVVEQMGNEPMIKLTPDTVRIDAMGGDVEVSVLSTVKRYNVGRPWFSRIVEKEGEKDKWLLTVNMNPGLEERTDRLYFGTPWGDTPDVSSYLIIVQEGNTLAEISIDKERATFQAGGGELTANVTCSWKDWEIKVKEEDAKWCHATRDGNKLKVVIDKSSLEIPREAVVTLSAGVGNNFASCDLVVSQLGTQKSLVLSTNKVTLNESGDEVVVDVVTNSDLWSVSLPESTDNWCTVIPDYANNKIKIKASPAQAGSRSVNLIAEIPQTDVKVNLTVIQSKYYKPGDFYVVNGKTLGIVYEVTDGGAHGKVVGLTAHRDMNIHYREGLPWDEHEKTGVGVIARSTRDGRENMKAYKQIDNWKAHFQVAAWVDNLNDENGFPGWYLPALEEVMNMVAYVDGFVMSPDGSANGYCTEEQKQKRKAFNQKLVDAGGKEFYFFGNDPSFLIDKNAGYEADYFNKVFTSTETDYQIHPMEYMFYLPNGWWATHNCYGEISDIFAEIRPFLAF